MWGRSYLLKVGYSSKLSVCRFIATLTSATLHAPACRRNNGEWTTDLSWPFPNRVQHDDNHGPRASERANKLATVCSARLLALTPIERTQRTLIEPSVSRSHCGSLHNNHDSNDDNTADRQQRNAHNGHVTNNNNGTNNERTTNQLGLLTRPCYLVISCLSLFVTNRCTTSVHYG